MGRKYKRSGPQDRGAPVYGGCEADYAEGVLEKARNLLEEMEEDPKASRRVRVMRGDEVLWSYEMDADAEVRWDLVGQVLKIEEGEGI